MEAQMNFDGQSAIYFSGHRTTMRDDRQEWYFGAELEGGLREWVMTRSGRLLHWGILLENTFVERMEMGMDGTVLQIKMFPTGKLSPMSPEGPLVLEASRSDTVERLMQRCLQLEAENQQLKA